MKALCIRALLGLAVCAAISACIDNGSSGDVVAVPAPLTTSSAATTPNLIGNAVDAPLTGATVNFYQLNADGSQGALLGTTITDSKGGYSVVLTAVPTAPILAVATGGSYIDEASGLAVNLAATDALTAVLPAGTV